MRNRLYSLIRESIRNVLAEATFPVGTRFKAKPGVPENVAKEFFAKKYGVDAQYLYPDPQMPGAYLYYPKKERKTPENAKRENETHDQYVERVRKLNKQFADDCQDLPGEEWRPLVNSGRYLKNQIDQNLGTYEVSNMGRVRHIDYFYPEKSFVHYGYPWKGSKGLHLKARGRSKGVQTSAAMHNAIADTFLERPEGKLKSYYVIHKNGNPEDNRVENLEYRPISELMKQSQTESIIRNIIRESVWDVLYENTQPNSRVRAGNQQYARGNQLQDDIKKFPKYYEELVNNGETYVSWADVSFDEWLIKNHPELNYDVKICADYFERTKFFLV